MQMEPAEVQKYRHDMEVVRNTAAQVIKDFGLAGHTIEFSGSPDNVYNELFDQVLPALRALFDKNESAFMALLYRIDVDEKKVMALRKNSTKATFFNDLAAEILEREFIKVLFRKLFSHQDGL
jgi:hypothetical protein